jgi:hypothetical protein
VYALATACGPGTNFRLPNSTVPMIAMPAAEATPGPGRPPVLLALDQRDQQQEQATGEQADPGDDAAGEAFSCVPCQREVAS